jgi:hypothetical protein
MDPLVTFGKALRRRLVKLGEHLWGCPHKKTSFPITLTTGATPETYVVCIQCGRRFPYDWKSMSEGGRAR